MSWRAWIADRFALRPIRREVLDRRVPKAPWYYGDGATLMLLLGVLILTGMAMSLTYSPSPEHAYDSVRYITHYQTLGWLVRGLHYWAAGMMVVMVFVHLFRQILLGGYKFPREGTWLVGVLLFFLVLTMAFTGYVLRWDERAVYAVTVFLSMLHEVPLIGNGLVLFVQGGAEMGAQTLSRMYAVHVVIVPVVILGLVGFHLYLVIVKGITAPGERRQPVRSVEEQRAIYKAEAESEERGEQFYPETAVKSGRMAMAVFALVVVLAVLAGPRRCIRRRTSPRPASPPRSGGSGGTVA
jgi:ubiquinol-cytochrome c reductase cytochrome b subunit